MIGEHYGRTQGGELIGPYDTVAELNVNLLVANLPDPDMVGQSEYRAIHDLLDDATSGYEADSGMEPKEWLLAILDEVESAVRAVRKHINEAEV